MKPPPFRFHRATNTVEAVEMLTAYDGDAKIIAGGQSLVPLLSMRLARPEALIDITGIDGMGRIDSNDGHVTLGALTRHRQAETSELVKRELPLLAEAMTHVGHLAIRNRGTLGGSASHADASAELPAVLLALDADMVIAGPGSTRTVSAHDFFRGYLTTALEPDEILTHVRVPTFPNGVNRTGHAVEELTRRHGDFAIVAVFVAVVVDTDGLCSDARISVAGAAPVALRAREAEAALVGRPLTDSVIATAAELVAAATLPSDDIHAPASYRRAMASVLSRRALRRSAVQASGDRV